MRSRMFSELGIFGSLAGYLILLPVLGPWPRVTGQSVRQ